MGCWHDHKRSETCLPRKTTLSGWSYVWMKAEKTRHGIVFRERTVCHLRVGWHWWEKRAHTETIRNFNRFQAKSRSFSKGRCSDSELRSSFSAHVTVPCILLFDQQLVTISAIFFGFVHALMLAKNKLSSQARTIFATCGFGVGAWKTRLHVFVEA